MKKEEAIKIVVECAKLYQNNLINKNIMFVFKGSSNVDYIETLFAVKNFKHLTGFESRLSADEFYSKCLNNKLPPKEIELKKDGTTKLKLDVLKDLMNIDKIATMIGDYEQHKVRLSADKIVGKYYACMGFKHTGKYYVPATTIKENIKNITYRPQSRILAIYKKDRTDKKYSECTYLATDIDISKFTSEIQDLIKIAINS